MSDQVAVRVLAEDVVDEHVLGDDDVPFQTHHLGDVGDTSRAIAQTRRLNNHINRGADHFADGARRQRIAAHGDH